MDDEYIARKNRALVEIWCIWNLLLGNLHGHSWAHGESKYWSAILMNHSVAIWRIRFLSHPRSDTLHLFNSFALQCPLSSGILLVLKTSVIQTSDSCTVKNSSSLGFPSGSLHRFAERPNKPQHSNKCNDLLRPLIYPDKAKPFTLMTFPERYWQRVTVLKTRWGLGGSATPISELGAAACLASFQVPPRAPSRAPARASPLRASRCGKEGTKPVP